MYNVVSPWSHGEATLEQLIVNRALLPGNLDDDRSYFTLPAAHSPISLPSTAASLPHAIYVQPLVAPNIYI